MNDVALGAAPAGVVTTTWCAPAAPGGVTATSAPVFVTVTDGVATPPTVTVVPPARKLVPVSVTVVPPPTGPVVGVRLVTVGGSAVKPAPTRRGAFITIVHWLPFDAGQFSHPENVAPGEGAAVNVTLVPATG